MTARFDPEHYDEVRADGTAPDTATPTHEEISA